MVLALGLGTGTGALVPWEFWCRARTMVGKVSACTGASPASTEERLLLEEPRSENRLALNAAPILQLLLLFPVGRDSTPPTSSRGFVLEPLRKDLWGAFGAYCYQGPAMDLHGILLIRHPLMGLSWNPRRTFLTEEAYYLVGALWHLEWTLATACEWGP